MVTQRRKSRRMQARFRAHLDEEFASRRRLPAQQGRLARRALVRHRLCRRRGAARRRPASPSRRLKEHRPPHHRDPARLQRPQDDAAPAASAAARWSRPAAGIDWSMAEHLAFGTLLNEGFPVRLSGQDSERGTFSQRHSVLDRPGDRAPLHAAQALSPRPGAASRSSTRCCRRRRCWASSTATRWPSRTRSSCGRRSSATSPTARRSCSTSSSPRASASGCACPASCACCRTATRARDPSTPRRALERYLQLCAEDNWQVANCTTPANYFHILRRQLHRKFRKPLILMTPKSLLRHKRVVSRPRRDGARHDVPSPAVGRRASHSPTRRSSSCPTSKIRRVVLCTGKVYYDLYEAREAAGIDDVYLLRVEQLYPFPARALMTRAVALPAGRDRLVPGGAQEHGRLELHRAQPRMGAGAHRGAERSRPAYAGRPASASTATGHCQKHLHEQKTLVEEALDGPDGI